MMKKLGVGLVAVVALAILAVLAGVLSLGPGERRSLRGDRVTELLKPFPWVKERVSIAELAFSLSGADGYPELALGAGAPLEREAGEELFTFDPERFISAQEAENFREAQLK